MPRLLCALSLSSILAVPLVARAEAPAPTTRKPVVLHYRTLSKMLRGFASHERPATTGRFLIADRKGPARGAAAR